MIAYLKLPLIDDATGTPTGTWQGIPDNTSWEWYVEAVGTFGSNSMTVHIEKLGEDGTTPVTLYTFDAIQNGEARWIEAPPGSQVRARVEANGGVTGIHVSAWARPRR